MYQYFAKVSRVVDGDTIDCEVNLGFYLCAKIRFRLARIDAPEMYGSKASEAGKVAKEYLEGLLATHGKNYVLIETEKTGKYGRWIAEVWAGDLNVSDALVTSGNAVYREY